MFNSKHCRKCITSMWWQHLALALIGVMFAFTSISSTAEDFSYELKAVGTENSDVTFSVNLTATGKETVKKAEKFSKVFPYFYVKNKWSKKCKTHTQVAPCLPLSCEVDYTQGDGSGYEIEVLRMNDHGKSISHDLKIDEDSGSWCVHSSVKVCASSGFGGGAWYEGNHSIYGKCTNTESWTQTQEKGPFSLNESDGFLKLDEYDGPIGSAEGEPDTASVDYYEASFLTSTPDDASSIQLGMFDGNPANNINGKEFWAKTNYHSPWISSKQSTAPIPTDGVIVIDSISETAPNNDTTYEVSISVPPNTYTQNERGIVDAVDLFGWLNPEHEFLVTADKKFLPPLAIIDNISQNPAPVETSVSFEGHGEHNDTPNSATIINAIWQTNRSDKALHTCSESPCNFEADDLINGQHLISFGVEAEGTTKSPEATEVLVVNQAPIVSIILTESTGETTEDGVKTVKVVKWKDDEFDPFHDPITFVGQAVDLDGIITEYEWKSNHDVVVGNELSFSYNNLSLGKHEITFRAKDDNDEWSNEVTKMVEVIKPPILLVHGLWGKPSSWKWDEGEKVGNGYPIHTIKMKHRDARFYDGAKEVSNKIEELTKEYGIPKINIVAHDMGGLNSRWYIQTPGYRNDVNKLVMLGTPNHGTMWAAMAKPSVSKSHAFAARLDIMGMGAGIGSGFFNINGFTPPIIGSLSKLSTNFLTTVTNIGGGAIEGAAYGAAAGKIVATGIGILGEITGGPALNELVPQSSALKVLNGNEKDAGYSRHQADDNIQTVYGSNVPYFNVNGEGFLTISHKHIIIPVVEWDIVLPKISLNGDLVVHNKSSRLDNVPSKRIEDVMHFDIGKEINVQSIADNLECIADKKMLCDYLDNGMKVIDMIDKEMPIPYFGRTQRGLPKHEKVLEETLYYLGDDPPKSSEDNGEEVDSTKALAGHTIYATDIAYGKVLPIVLAGETQEQQFEVDSTIKNLDVTIMGIAKDEKIPSLQLLSPSGVVIDENTTLSNVEYDSDNNSINSTYHITGTESGTWTAIIESSSDDFAQYALIATGETDFWVGVVEGTQVEPGAPFTIQAYVQKEGNPMSGLNVSAMLIKTLDEGERIGSKYGPDLRDVEPITVDLADLGDGRYEIVYEDTIATGVYRIFITAHDPATDTSRVTLTTFFVEYDYELTVQSEDIVFSNDAPEHNETITVSANIHNESNIDAKGVEVWFADGRLDQGGAVFAKKTLDNIAANNTAIISTSWIATADTKEVFVIVSPMNTFIETNVDNNTASKAINPLDLPPVADAGMDQKARFDKDTQTNVHIFLDGSGSTDELKIERYEWDIDTSVDSNGDGINDNDVDLTGVRPFIPAGTYTTLGEYEVKLTVFDVRNQSHSDTLTIQHTEEYDFEPPIADAGLDQIVTLKTPVYFDGSKSSDNYGIATYTWDIDTNTDSNGDGIADNDVDLIGTHPVLDGGYEEKGIYTVQLTVRDVAGNDPATDTLIVEINKPLTYSVSGYVQDEFGNPVTDVLVEINDQETTTDENGYYQINELVEGEYTITAKAQSHNFKPQTVQIGSENPGLELNFTASKAPIDAPILYLVIDDTGSMRDNINGVQLALTEYIEILQQAIVEGEISPLSVLLTFKDQDEIYSRIVTDNLNELLEQVKLLEAEGGDDCAEDSVVALNQVAAEIGEGGTILLATDAPPHEGYDELTTLIEQLRDKGITINIILTEAYCSDKPTTRRKRAGSEHFEKSIEAYSRIANEVGNGSSLSIIKRSANKPEPASEEWLQAYKDVALNIMLGTIQPTVTTVSPTHVPQGGTLDLYITAANANFNKSSLLYIDGGIKVNKIHSVSPNQIIANVTIPANTDLSRYDMRINTSLTDGSVETTHGIGVIAVDAAPENPEIISIASLQNGLQVLISGINTHFEPDVTQLKFADTNITLARLTVHNETLLEARLYVNENARLGLHDLTITTGDEVIIKNQLPVFMIPSSNTTNDIPQAPINNKFCDSLGEVITTSCHNKVLGDKHIGPHGYVTHGEIAGQVTSEGWVSSVTILPDAMLDGGIVTGYIDNQGIIANIDHRGGLLTGGNLAGNIIVNDEITQSNLGVFKNVTLLQGANINGGIFEETVTGKGSIKNANFRANVKLSGITIDEGCQLAEGVEIGTGVRFTDNDSIPEETDLSAALTTDGEIDFSTDVVMDAPSLLNQINALPDMQDNNWQLEQNAGRLEVMVDGTRMRVKPKRVKQAKRNRHAEIIIHGDGTVTVITAKGREILVEVQVVE